MSWGEWVPLRKRPYICVYWSIRRGVLQADEGAKPALDRFFTSKTARAHYPILRSHGRHPRCVYVAVRVPDEILDLIEEEHFEQERAIEELSASQERVTRMLHEFASTVPPPKRWDRIKRRTRW